MTTVRAIYLATAATCLDLLTRPEVGERWDDESVLPEFRVGGLAGHLARSTLQVESFLDAPPPTGEPITAVTYYAQLVGVQDRDSELNVGVRARGEEVAAAGHAELVQSAGACLERLHERLPAEPEDRLLSAFGRTLVLDEYLRTRLIEMTVHIDDLAISVGVPPPPVPTEAHRMAIETLVGVGREKHGDLAVLQALTRRERDDADALHIL